MRNFLLNSFAILLITLASSVYNDLNALAPGIYFYCEEDGKSEIINIVGEVVASGTTDYTGERKCGKFKVCSVAPNPNSGNGGLNGQQSNPQLLQILLRQSPTSQSNVNAHVTCNNCPDLGFVYEHEVRHL